MGTTRSGTGWPAGETVPEDRRLPPGGAIAVFLDRIAAAEAVLAKVPAPVAARIPPEREIPPGAGITGSSGAGADSGFMAGQIPLAAAPAPGADNTRSRQRGRHRKKPDRRKRALRRWALAFTAAVTVTAVLGGVMVALHGPAFFVFRKNGTGATGDFPGSHALLENQGPGQPDAPPAARPDQPARPPLLIATAPGGLTVTVPLKPGLAWAGIAQRRLDGQWTVLDDGASRAQVQSATAIHFNRHSAEYAAAWYVVPLRRT